MGDASSVQHSCRHLELLDVLRTIPIDVVRTNIWTLLQREGQHTLRQVCRSARRLSEELILRFSQVVLEGEQGEPDLLQRQSALLSRLPALQALAIGGWDSESSVLECLVLDGAAAPRITALQLRGRGLSLGATCAIRSAWPALKTLEITGGEAPWHTEGRGLLLDGDVFLPLAGAALTELSIHGAVLLFDSLRSLGRLTALVTLHLHVDFLPAGALRPLSSLAALTNCSVTAFWTPLTSLLEAAPLFALTRLTRLTLPDVTNHRAGGVTAADAASDVAAAAATAAAVDVAAAQLGQLVCLRSLRLCWSFTLTEAGLGALQQLSHLTSLSVGRMGVFPRVPPAGQLPWLRDLCVDEMATPVDVLRWVVPLMPLAALTRLRSRGPPGGELRTEGDRLDLNVEADGAAAAAVQLVALHLLAGHLAQAPRLRMGTISLHSETPDAEVLGLPQVLEGLKLLSGRLRCLCLRGLRLGAVDLCRLQRLLPALTSLDLHSCPVRGSGLVALGLHCPALRTLRVTNCPSLSRDAWLGLAAVRATPLRVLVRLDDPLSFEAAVGDLVDSVEVQQAAYGTWNMRVHVLSDHGAEEEGEAEGEGD